MPLPLMYRKGYAIWSSSRLCVRQRCRNRRDKVARERVVLRLRTWRRNASLGQIVNVVKQ